MEIIKDGIMEAFLWRDACKFYDPAKKVSDEDMKFILEIARMSPSSFGYEPWRFLVFQDFTFLNEIKEHTWGLVNSLNGASHIVIILARKKVDMQAGSAYVEYIMNECQRLPKEVLERRRLIFNEFLERDMGAITEREVFDWSSKQTYIALGNMLTTAALLNIDACPIEGFNYEVLETMLEEKGLIDSHHFGVSVIVSFGYRSREPDHEKTRQPTKNIVEYI